MRTTINLPDAVLREARIQAAKQQSSLAHFVTTAIQRTLSSAPPTTPLRKVRLPTFRGRGLQPGVNLDDTSDLLDLMEGRR